MLLQAGESEGGHFEYNSMQPECRIQLFDASDATPAAYESFGTYVSDRNKFFPGNSAVVLQRCLQVAVWYDSD